MEVKLMYIPHSDKQNKPFGNYYYLRKKSLESEGLYRRRRKLSMTS